MSLENIQWIKQALGMGQQIHEGNDINFVTHNGKPCFQFDVVNLKSRAEFSNGETRDNFNKEYHYTGNLYLPSRTVDISDGGLVVMQWHGIGPTGRIPLSIQLENGLLIVNHQMPTQGFERLYECTIPYDREIKFRIEVQFGQKILIHMDDDLIVDHGPHLKEEEPPYFKYGAYRTGVPHGEARPRVTIYWSDVLRVQL